MASARDVKNRIKSVKNIAQITRALEAVSASRVRRAQERVLASRNYAEKAWEILLNVNAATKGQAPHAMLTERETVDHVLVVLITSDRGLAGSYNTNVMRVADRFEKNIGKPVKYITVGRKGRDSMIRMGKDVIAEFSDLPANPSVADIKPIANLAMDEFLSGNVDEVLIAYTDFITMLTQSPVILGWLPLTPNSVANTVAAEHVKTVPVVSENATDYEYEPNAVAVIDEIVPRFTELQLYQALLESQASEHAARMAAMRNATDNASGLVDDLTLEYNKARQAAITNEILDIVGGASALEASLKAKADSHTAASAQSVISQMKSGLGEAGTTSTNGNEDQNGTSDSKKNRTINTAKRDNVPSAEDHDVADVTTAYTDSAAVSDDLTQIEGIGKKTAAALNAEGYYTYTDLANADADELQAALARQDMQFTASAESWSEQASYAVNDDWDGLRSFQSNLDGGEYTSAVGEVDIVSDVPDYDVADVTTAYTDTSSEDASAQPDDLTKIEGIGPKMAAALDAEGYHTFADVAAASEADLKAAMERQGMRFAPSAESWSEQASYAASENWDGLATLQDRLISGRYPESIEREKQAQTMAKTAVPVEPDDLTKVEGIGPKMNAALNDAGILTFAQLAEATEEQLSQAIQDAGMRFAPSLPTWAEQAGYAARADWDGLATLQDQLKAGRRDD